MRKCQLKATAKYQKKAYDKITIRVKKGLKDYWKDNLKGESLAGFITTAVNEKIKNNT